MEKHDNRILGNALTVPSGKQIHRLWSFDSNIPAVRRLAFMHRTDYSCWSAHTRTHTYTHTYIHTQKRTISKLGCWNKNIAGNECIALMAYELGIIYGALVYVRITYIQFQPSKPLNGDDAYPQRSPTANDLT